MKWIKGDRLLAIGYGRNIVDVVVDESIVKKLDCLINLRELTYIIIELSFLSFLPFWVDA